MNKKHWLTGLFGILLVSFLVLSCPEEDPPPDGSGIWTPILTKPERPVMSDLLSSNYTKNATAAPLTVKATVTEGVLSYQWYKTTGLSAVGGEPVGTDNASYTPLTDEEGDTYYYVVVTNTDATKEDPTLSRTSNLARIRVTTAAVTFPTPAVTITVDNATKYQYIRGFGGMSNVWTSPYLNQNDIDRMFDPDNGLGYNILRICIYPIHENLFNGIQGAPANRPDAHYFYYEMVKRAKSHGAYILASPWTMRAEWKEGYSVNPVHYGDYAYHLKDYLDVMEDNGATVDYVSMQNEPDADVDYDGCAWTGPQTRDFVKAWRDIVAPRTRTDGRTPVKFMPGESFQWRDAAYNATRNDPDAWAKVDVVAGHMYGGIPSNPLRTAVKNDNKELWMTEHLFNTENNYWIDSQWAEVWKVVTELHRCMATLDFNAYVWWYSKRFYSLIGDGEYGTLNGMPLYRGYALSHFAKYATGKTRVETSVAGTTANVVGQYADPNTSNPLSAFSSSLYVTAYEDDNEITLVLFNRHATAIGEVAIALPDGVTASGASMVITQGAGATDVSEGKKMDPDIVLLSSDKTTGVLNVPASCIISVRFTKAGI